MPIPKDVLAVDRPKNSIVIAYGKNRDRYAVRARVGCRSDGQRRLPVNGPTIGHIVGEAMEPICSKGFPQSAAKQHFLDPELPFIFNTQSHSPCFMT